MFPDQVFLWGLKILGHVAHMWHVRWPNSVLRKAKFISLWISSPVYGSLSHVSHAVKQWLCFCTHLVKVFAGACIVTGLPLVYCPPGCLVLCCSICFAADICVSMWVFSIQMHATTQANLAAKWSRRSFSTHRMSFAPCCLDSASWVHSDTVVALR